MVQSGYTGWYCAVLKVGAVCAGDAIELVAGERAIRIDEKHRLITKTAQSDLF
jgi:MOSC domain-containing protein YiiM